ncbi:MAG: TRAP transporter small permease [Alphaproteobacteria bacterium]|nr:TRAP transporter small permease [Alphaproteobacteria bacterium]MDX5368110.1 TRAP transporter small permease [Alphaproteobacteria bacterium]MDX5462949.1 TRAP transporter small permease [Alphaproteobacteria bacterium]
MRHPLQALHEGLLRLEIGGALVSGAFVLVIMLAGCAEIVGRGLFNAPIHGYLDIIEQTMVAVALFGVSYCQATLGNVRMTLLIGAMSGRPRWVAEAVSLLVCLFVALILMQGSWNHFLRAWQIGGSTAEIDIPTWISTLLVPVSFAVLSARLVLQILDAVRVAVNPDTDPLVIPVSDHGHGAADEPKGDGTWTP